MIIFASVSGYHRDFLKRTKSPASSFMFKPVTTREVELEILALPNNKSHGLYSCPTTLLKYSSTIISDILPKIVNLSVTSGSYPSKLKKAKVIPVFKTEDETDANNYRPISLLSVFDRIFEKVMYKRMMHFINDKNILFSAQYGFRGGFSTEHAIVDIVTAIQSNMDKPLFTCGIFIDLKESLRHS